MDNKILKLNSEKRLKYVLSSSLYPGASEGSINLVISYCKAAGLDPMQKPVHIVPMWDKNTRSMRDVIMPGIGLYRIQAGRSGCYGGMSDPVFGEDVTEVIDGVELTYPKTCKITVKRLLKDGGVGDFSSVERWKENYAMKGGKERSKSPNAMWLKRPYGQLAKCAEAQALRKAFPEIGAQPTFEEMEGKDFNVITPESSEANEYMKSFATHQKTISAIIEGLSNNNLEMAIEARQELSNEDLSSIWVSPKKCKELGIDAPFTTQERALMRSDEWNELAVVMIKGDK